MNCHRCGKPLEDGSQFCEECGAPVEFPQQPPIPGQVVPEKALAQDNTMKKIALVLGAVCVALVVAVVLLLVFRMRNNAGKSGESAAVQTVSVTEVTAGETTNEAATEAVAAVAETTAAPATEAPTQAPAETAAVKRTADYSLYLRAVKQFVLSDQLVYREYYLYDIDRDGVNELIVQYGTCEADTIYAFWRIDDSGTGIEKLGEFPGGHSYLCSQDGVLYTNLGHMGYQSVSAAELVKENGVWKINWREVFTQENVQDVADYADFGPALQGYDLANTAPLGGSDNSQSATAAAGSSAYAINDKLGAMDCHKGVVSSYTTDYVCNGGEKNTVRQSLGDGWHVTAKYKCESYGVTWYELWDTDDGDYYGWVDEEFIDFY